MNGSKKSFRRSGRDLKKSHPEVIILSNNLLITWFCNHIRTIDAELGMYL